MFHHEILTLLRWILRPTWTQVQISTRNWVIRIRDETDIDGPRGTDAESDQAFESDQAMGDMAQLDVDQTWVIWLSRKGTKLLMRQLPMLYRWI